MSENPGFESSEDNGDIWTKWIGNRDDGLMEVPELPSVILRAHTNCPHCNGKIALNYTARGIVFDHDDRLAHLEAENAALKRGCKKFSESIGYDNGPEDGYAIVDPQDWAEFDALLATQEQASVLRRPYTQLAGTRKPMIGGTEITAEEQER